MTVPSRGLPRWRAVLALCLIGWLGSASAQAPFGQVLWSTPLRLGSPPAITADGTVYALVGDEYQPDRYRHYLACYSHEGTMRWQVALGTESSSSTSWRLSPVVRGDDGRLFFGSPKQLWCFDADGNQLWQRPIYATSTDDTPNICLGPGRSLYSTVAGWIQLWDYEGNQVWKIAANASGANEQLLTRRNGNLLVPYHAATYTPAGQRLSVSPYGFAGALLTSDDRAIILQVQGELGAFDPANTITWSLPSFTSSGSSVAPAVLLENGEIAASGAVLRLAPYGGSTFRDLSIEGNYHQIVAGLVGSRMIVVTDATVRLVEPTGAITGSFTLPAVAHNGLGGGSKFTVGPRGKMFIDGTLTAYSAQWPVASTGWPLRQGDPLNTGRDVGTAAATAQLVFSVKIEGPAQGYVGFSTVLQGHSWGAAADLQWWHNGSAVPGGTGPELLFPSTRPEDAGTYVLTATNAGGRFQSDPFTLNVVAPVPTPPGRHVGRWPSAADAAYHPFILNAYPTGQFHFVITGPEGIDVYGRLAGDGSFALPTTPAIAGRLAGGQLTFTAGPSRPVLPSLAPASGVTSGGVATGLYSGRGRGPVATRGSALVLADGSIAVGPAWPVGAAAAFATAFAAGETQIAYKAGPEDYNSIIVDGSQIGVLQIGHRFYYPDREDFTLLAEDLPAATRLSNLAARSVSVPGELPFSVGLVVVGDAPNPVLLRGVGPGLALVGVSDAVNSTLLELFDPTGQVVRSNHAWGTQDNYRTIGSTAVRLGAFPLSPTSQDSALLEDLAPGLHSMSVRSNDGSSGTVLLEAYRDTAGHGGSFSNLSTRGQIGGKYERPLIGGFVLEGTQPKTVLIRVAGPALQPFLPATIHTARNPVIDLHVGNEVYARYHNQDWMTDAAPDIAEIAQYLGAFPFAPGSHDAAMLLSLAPGAYSAVTYDEDQTGGGTAILEIYVLNP